MRTRYALLACMVAVGLASLVLAQDQGVQSIVGDVFLQSTTPGTAQVGHATITGTFRAGQVFVQQGSIATIPVVGNSTATGNGDAVGASFSSAQMQGIGVRGTSTAVPGAGIGVLGIGRGANSAGILGRLEGVSDTQGAAVKAVVTAGKAKGVDSRTDQGTAGFFFSTTGTGIHVLNNSLNGTPALFANNPVDQAGVTSIAARFIGKTMGLHSRAESTGQTQTVGVQGESTSTDGIGVWGLASRTTSSSYGVFGDSKSTTNGTGVFGVAAGQGLGVGVYGRGLSTTGFGVFSDGRTGATGTKSFVIDHPLDPENRYLLHYSAEGPEPRNVYQGSVVTDSTGYATVRLPSYYESINRDPLIQLTVIDGSADFVMVKVVRKVDNGRFQIRTSKPRVEVNWRVDAVRNDRWVQKFGHEVEPVKPEIARGTYLQPELYGMPESKAQMRTPTGPGTGLHR
ncbi:MAG: hypothetical protein JST30_09655 [Armatimonadetes bacterium]|nr:hypothetical protein [Armatimonadota bacterium]